MYITEEHLSNFKEIVNNVRASNLNVVSVHTPRVTHHNKEKIRKADELAVELNAYLIVHSQHILNIKSKEIELMSLKSHHGYENNPGTSYHCLKNSILGRGYGFVLDLAHLYIAEENYLEILKELMENYQEQIEVIHLADATETDDGLDFWEGEIDLKNSLNILRKHNFDGIMVLEVMPEKQEEAKEKLERDFTF